MAEVCAVVITTFEWSTTWPRTDMLSLELFSSNRGTIKESFLLASLRSQALGGKKFSWTTSLTTLVPATIQCMTACSHAPRWFRLAIASVAYCLECIATTATFDRYLSQAGWTVAYMTFLGAGMTTA